MDIVKGDQWSSAGKTSLGIGLAGPVALDNRRIYKSSAARGDPMDVDEDYGVSVGTKPVRRDSGFCHCGMPYNKSQMVLCVGPVSQNMLLPFFFCLNRSRDGGCLKDMAVM